MNKLILLTLLSVGLTACSMTKVKVDPEGMQQAKKVAIVGFNLLVEEPKSMMGDLKKLGSLAKGELEDANQESATADQLYATLATRLSREMN